MRVCLKLVKFPALILVAMIAAVVNAYCIMSEGNVLSVFPILILAGMIAYIQIKISMHSKMLVTMPLKREKLYGHMLLIQMLLMFVFLLTDIICLLNDRVEAALAEWICFNFMVMIFFAVEMFVRLLCCYNALRESEYSLAKYLVLCMFIIIYIFYAVGYMQGELTNIMIHRENNVIIWCCIAVGILVMAVSVLFMRLSIMLVHKSSD